MQSIYTLAASVRAAVEAIDRHIDGGGDSIDAFTDHRDDLIDQITVARAHSVYELGVKSALVTWLHARGLTELRSCQRLMMSVVRDAQRLPQPVALRPRRGVPQRAQIITGAPPRHLTRVS
jgi:hypothetical protein